MFSRTLIPKGKPIMPVIKRTAVSREMHIDTLIVRSASGSVVFDENMGSINWKRVRLRSDFEYRLIPADRSVSFSRTQLGGTDAILAFPQYLSCKDIVLGIHGGGFVTGSMYGSKAYLSMLAERLEACCIAIDYSLAPENPYPAGLDDIFRAYKAILHNFPDSKVALAGSSAGANLCFALTVRCLKEGVRLPSCILAHSGLYDFTDSSERDYEIDDFTVKPGVYSALPGIYAPGQDLHSPEISPLFYEDFTKFPPAVFTCDSKETLKADSYAMYRKYEKAHVPAVLYEFENTFHAFASVGNLAPETTKLLRENCRFIKKYNGSLITA